MTKVFRPTPDRTAPAPGEEVDAVEISLDDLQEIARGIAISGCTGARIKYTPDKLSLCLTSLDGSEVSRPLARRVTKFRAYIGLTNLTARDKGE